MGEGHAPDIPLFWRSAINCSAVVNRTASIPAAIAPATLSSRSSTKNTSPGSALVDDKLDDYGAAYPGFLILNPRLLNRVSPSVKLWIHAHECGHQFRGPDEETADCFAVQRGRRQGWLTLEGLDEVCKFISPAKGDSMHFSGSHRCELMRKCYADPTVK
jgi:hypothetical protein